MPHIDLAGDYIGDETGAVFADKVYFASSLSDRLSEDFCFRLNVLCDPLLLILGRDSDQDIFNSTL